MVPPLVELALAYYRRPLDYGHLADIERPLPPGFPNLLADFGAALSAARIEETARLLSTEADELEAAARFFVRHALLNPAADHYRCLGLNRDSTNEELRSNYQILIRMFHPDRLREFDDVDLAYSSRINAAYRVLRDPASRARYHKSLRGRRTSSPRRDHGDYFRPQVETIAKARQPGRLSRLGHPLKRPWILITTLLILGTATAYLVSREPKHATLRLTKPAIEVERQQALPRYLTGLGSDATQLETTGLTTAQPTTTGELVTDATTISPATTEELLTASPVPIRRRQAAEERLESADEATSRLVPLSTASVDTKVLTEMPTPEQMLDLRDFAETLKPAPGPATAIEPTTAAPADLATARSPGSEALPAERQPEPKKQTSVDQRVARMVQAAIADTQAPKPKPRPERKPEPEPAPRPAVADGSSRPEAPASKAQVQPRQPARATPQPAPSTSPERAALTGARMVGRLEHAYRSGNAAAFAALFSSNARTTDGNGRSRIQRQYRDLFRGSLEQSMTIRRMRWSRGAGGLITGTGQVSVSVRDRTTGWRRLNGSIRIELAEQGGGYLVTGLFYDVN